MKTFSFVAFNKIYETLKETEDNLKTLQKKLKNSINWQVLWTQENSANELIIH